MIPLVLASQSRDRNQCFKRAHIPVVVIPSNFNESTIQHPNPKEKIRIIAQKKAKVVVHKWNSTFAPQKGPAIIIAADTMGKIHETLLGKPTTKSEAFTMISQLSGKSHEVYTAVSLIHTETLQHESVFSETTVHFQSLTEDEIWGYLADTDEYLTRAAAYSILDRASLFIDWIEGSFSNVIGIPMAEVRETLQKFGIDILSDRG